MITFEEYKHVIGRLWNLEQNKGSQMRRKMREGTRKRLTDEDQYSVLSWSVPVWAGDGSWWILLGSATSSSPWLLLSWAEMTKWFVDFGIEICGFRNCICGAHLGYEAGSSPWLLLSKSHSASTSISHALLKPPKTCLHRSKILTVISELALRLICIKYICMILFCIFGIKEQVCAL